MTTDICCPAALACRAMASAPARSPALSAACSRLDWPHAGDGSSSSSAVQKSAGDARSFGEASALLDVTDVLEMERLLRGWGSAADFLLDLAPPPEREISSNMGRSTAIAEASQRPAEPLAKKELGAEASPVNVWSKKVSSSPTASLPAAPGLADATRSRTVAAETTTANGTKLLTIGERSALLRLIIMWYGGNVEAKGYVLVVMNV
mmetsp:Transcript_16004/g.45389  ORF Transcript_16004/g.45389 Transcript_16004/m.45389 type:complete len:207 (-) Transcript_16004:25-645(-)